MHQKKWDTKIKIKRPPKPLQYLNMTLLQPKYFNHPLPKNTPEREREMGSIQTHKAKVRNLPASLGWAKNPTQDGWIGEAVAGECCKNIVDESPWEKRWEEETWERRSDPQEPWDHWDVSWEEETWKWERLGEDEKPLHTRYHAPQNSLHLLHCSGGDESYALMILRRELSPSVQCLHYKR